MKSGTLKDTVRVGLLALPLWGHVTVKSGVLAETQLRISDFLLPYPVSRGTDKRKAKECSEMHNQPFVKSQSKESYKK